MIAALLYGELAKLKHSLVGALCLGAPLLVTIMAALIAARQPPAPFGGLMLSVTALWGYFVMPLAITALAMVLAQIEHASRAWDHVLALPVERSSLFWIKTLVITLLTLMMTLALAPLTALAGALIAIAAPEAAPTGRFVWAGALGLLTMQWLASLFVTALQLWTALRFRSFIAPLGLGLAGTFAVVAGMGAPELAVLPWAMPIGVLEVGGAQSMAALLLGAGGGVVTSLLMVADLARKDFS